jgi:ADP-heptose:LPS heptosyltransferase
MRDVSKPRCALLFPGALGDFICLLPALGAVTRKAHIDVFAKSEFADIAPQGVTVSALERYEINRLFAGAGLEARVREFFARYETVYSWFGSREAVFVQALRGAARNARLFPFRGAAASMHQIDYYLSCLELSATDADLPKIPLRTEAFSWSRDFWDFWALDDRAVLVVAPGSGAREKNWPAEYFAALGRWWCERTRGKVVVLLGPVEDERGGFESLVEEFITARKLDLAQVAALLARANLFVGNDSGTTHLAAAVGTPTVALFGPSEARNWAPRGDKVLVLRRGIGCSPCAVELMRKCQHRECLTELFPEELIAELARFVGSAP